MHDGVEVRLLADFRLRVGGEEVRRWRAGKARSLFHYLIPRRGTIVPCERLNEVLWPGEYKARSNSSLKVAAHALRRVLHDAALALPEAEVRLDFEDFGYVLRAPKVWVDIDAFADLAQRASALECGGKKAAAVACYKAAAAVYRGDFLPCETADWAEEQRAWLRSTYLTVVHRLGSLCVCEGDEFGAIAWYRKALEVDPFNEIAYQAMMQLHGRRGEMGMVMYWYSQCEARLERELGVPVSEQTRETVGNLLRTFDFPGRRPR